MSARAFNMAATSEAWNLRRYTHLPITEEGEGDHKILCRIESLHVHRLRVSSVPRPVNNGHGRTRSDEPYPPRQGKIDLWYG